MRSIFAVLGFAIFSFSASAFAQNTMLYIGDGDDVGPPVSVIVDGKPEGAVLRIEPWWRSTDHSINLVFDKHSKLIHFKNTDEMSVIIDYLKAASNKQSISISFQSNEGTEIVLKNNVTGAETTLSKLLQDLDVQREARLRGDIQRDSQVGESNYCAEATVEALFDRASLEYQGAWRLLTFSRPYTEEEREESEKKFKAARLICQFVHEKTHPSVSDSARRAGAPVTTKSPDEATSRASPGS